MVDRKGLKNRGRSRADVEDRRRAVSDLTETKLEAIGDYSFDPELASKNIENMIGVTHVPLGFAGPVAIRGDHAGGAFLVPMATTEGALVASVSRGMSVISESGGARAKVLSDAMTRAPVFRTEGIDHITKVINWLCENAGAIDDAVSATTRHGRRMTIEPYPNGRNLFLRFAYDTGDAMGMNMVTIATEAVCRLIEKETGAVMVSVSGNMCTDKKPAAVNAINGRGKVVIAEATVPGSLVESKLHTTAAAIAETNTRKNLIGSAMAGSMGSNAPAANMAAAVYIATGQDPAHVVEASLCMPTCEDVEGDLYIAVRMPAVEVGTVGGGTRLPAQSEALEIMGCKGDGKARKFAEIVAVTVLAGEQSTLAAPSAGQLGNAHKDQGR